MPQLYSTRASVDLPPSAYRRAAGYETFIPSSIHGGRDPRHGTPARPGQTEELLGTADRVERHLLATGWSPGLAGG